MATNTENYNEDELEPPQWMDAEFFQKVLRHCEKSSEVVVKSFKISPATVKGDHYASVMFRGKVDYTLAQKPKQKSLIIKTLPEVDGVKKDLLQESHIFETEIGMYTEVLPRFEQILRSIGDDTVLKAPCLYHSLSPKKIIIFEDLVPQGYTVLCNKEMSYEEVQVACSKLAKWHAISYKILQEEPKYFDQYRHGMYCIKEWVDVPVMRDAVLFFAEFLRNEPKFSQYAKYFENSCLAILEKCKESFKSYRENRRDDVFYALCHGDFHKKNIMLKYKANGDLDDLMLLDFQLAYVGPMHNDLAYCFYMMMDSETRAKKIDEVVYDYHQIFIQTLEKIGFEGKVPSLVQLRQQMLDDRYLELHLVAGFLPMWLKFIEGDVDMDRMMCDTDYQKSFFHNPLFQKEIAEILPKYLHRGYLENLPQNQNYSK